jgi:prepilin-type N-terminal cleavage/methylation domain-containing protein
LGRESIKRYRERGFTMIELVMVIVLISIVAGVAAPVLFGNSSGIDTGVMVRKVLSDVRYAQSLAMRRSNIPTTNVSSPNFRYRIRFNVPDASCAYTNQYTIVNDSDSNGTWGENPNGTTVVESGRAPVTGAEYFCVQLDTGDYAGLSVTANFGGTETGTLEFDGLGIPYDSDGVKLLATATITVSKGTASRTILVTPYTGAASIQ